ncbi:splicing factor 3b subunit 4 [Metarhizium album ARSEF 1941]|uniref:Splicing factor 3b subunit 4 n=1 Tax=Metarhizium album (strain ARSEF 1941) TaxID=1081103 RepID=A0A0B2WZ08_METAS|nr:splicing factor 3b subunit 4 [Metarhizium album ARSEF 1941]KHO01537.1 splicing factor 3b subunit 4 [Metarhizium album ARSEF 1941]
MAQNRHWEQDKEATIYIGNIDERATTATIYEVMLQMGPIHNIHMPRDRVTQNHQGFGFVEFRTPSDAEYAANVMNGIKLFGKSLRVNKASADKQKGADIGAELFIGNLDPMVDEKLLYDTFSRFGPLLSLPKVARDDGGMSKGFGFVSFGDFESSDAAVANLDGQYMLSKEVSVQYAFKKDGRGERHGDEAERELAKQAKKRNIVPEAQALPAFVTQQSQPQPPPPHQPPSQQQHQQPPPLPLPPSKGGQQSPVPTGFDPAKIPPPLAGLPGHALPPMAAAHHHAPPPPPPPPNLHRNSPFGAGPHSQSRSPAALPPPPTGLPARPPQSQNYTNPADFHPGAYRPPSASPNPPGYPVAPPPGFPAGPPGALGQQGPPGAGPPGFMPPPGFQPPPGFGRR